MSFTLPTICPHCGQVLQFDGIHLMCTNEDCPARIAKILSYGVGVLDLKSIGGKTIEPFAKDFKNIIEVMVWVLGSRNKQGFSLEPYGIKSGSRSEEIFINSFTTIQSLEYHDVIIALGYNGVGKKLSQQLAKEYCGGIPDYSGLERALVEKMTLPNNVEYIKDVVNILKSLGVKINEPEEQIVKEDTIFACLTGSPKEHGFKTKEEFLKAHSNVVEVSLSDKKCNCLITDSYTSTSSKMKVAKNKNIKIVTYTDIKTVQ